MTKKIKVRVRMPRILYPGSMLQNTFSEDLDHYWLSWDIQPDGTFSVKKRKLPNEKPFITYDWEGNIDVAIDALRSIVKPGCRVRIRSKNRIPLQISTKLVSFLKNDAKVGEVTFKEDVVLHVVDDQHRVQNADLRNVEVLVAMLREHYKISHVSEDEWNEIRKILSTYVGSLEDSCARDTTWSLKRLQFSNLFGYGEANSINFEALSGIVGLAGPNKSGKSSIPGSLMYTLFNSTDRGSIKNAFVCNTRKNSCQGMAWFNVSGRDYAVKRSSSKREDDPTSASTNLKLYDVVNGKFVENSGEQRNDTDKTVRKLIGTAEDFCLMSMTAQRDDYSLLNNGNTRRRQIISRYGDIDVLQKIHELARDDVKKYKSLIKVEADLTDRINEKSKLLEQLERSFDERSNELNQLRSRRVELNEQLARFGGVETYTTDDVERELALISKLRSSIEHDESTISTNRERIKQIEEKRSKIESLRSKYDLGQLKSQLEAFRASNHLVKSLRSNLTVQENQLNASRRTLSILDDVPCGDSFPTCKFIKNAHELKGTITLKEEEVNRLRHECSVAESKLSDVDESRIVESIKKVESLIQHDHKLQIDHSKCESSIHSSELHLSSIQEKLDERLVKVERMKARSTSTVNLEVSKLRNDIGNIESRVIELEADCTNVAIMKGRIMAELDAMIVERDHRDEVLRLMKSYEIIESSFSKHGLQDSLLVSLLPRINTEMASVLSGITNMTITLDKKPHDDQIEIYVDDGDGDRRLLELGSGAEKFIGSIALRLALHNMSTMPKSDVFIIDEGFGSLDPDGTEDCIALLKALKNHFKTILVITHQDAIKGVFDSTIEITRNGRDAKVVVS